MYVGDLRRASLGGFLPIQFLALYRGALALWKSRKPLPCTLFHKTGGGAGAKEKWQA